MTNVSVLLTNVKICRFSLDICKTLDMRVAGISFAFSCYSLQWKIKKKCVGCVVCLWDFWGWLACRASSCAALMRSCIFCFFHSVNDAELFWLASAPLRLGLCERGSLGYWWKFICSALHDEEDGILACFHVQHLAVVKQSALTDAFHFVLLQNLVPYTVIHT